MASPSEFRISSSRTRKLKSRVATDTSMLIPRELDEIEQDFCPLPDDARAMSPRRNTADTQKLCNEIQETLQEQARTLQSALEELADKTRQAAQACNKLESENKFLQDYISSLITQEIKEVN